MKFMLFFPVSSAHLAQEDHYYAFKMKFNGIFKQRLETRYKGKEKEAKYLLAT
jgi:hypothetical protein